MKKNKQILLFLFIFLAIPKIAFATVYVGFTPDMFVSYLVHWIIGLVLIFGFKIVNKIKKPIWTVILNFLWPGSIYFYNKTKPILRRILFYPPIILNAVIIIGFLVSLLLGRHISLQFWGFMSLILFPISILHIIGLIHSIYYKKQLISDNNTDILNKNKSIFAFSWKKFIIWFYLFIGCYIFIPHSFPANEHNSFLRFLAHLENNLWYAPILISSLISVNIFQIIVWIYTFISLLIGRTLIIILCPVWFILEMFKIRAFKALYRGLRLRYHRAGAHIDGDIVSVIICIVMLLVLYWLIISYIFEIIKKIKKRRITRHYT